MTKTIKLLSHGLFEKPFMDSRVQSRTLSKKEEILGHLVGPLGLIFVVNTIAALVEKFFTQQTGAIYGVENLDMVRVMGHQYEVVMTFTKILAVAWGSYLTWIDNGGQPAPVGITVAGPQNMRFSDRDWFIPYLRHGRFWPGVYAWPATESYFDAYRIAPENEYTVQGSIGPNLYNWGYLAAMKE